MTAFCGATLVAFVDEGRRMQLSCKDALATISTPETKVKIGVMPTLIDQAGTTASTKAHLGYSFTDPQVLTETSPTWIRCALPHTRMDSTNLTASK